jgi:hypothetical protein
MFKLSERFLLNINILWFCYSVIILASMDVSWEKVLKEETDFDDRGGHNTNIIEHLDGPYTKNEIDELYSNDLNESKKLMYRYGTVYNLPYWIYNKNSQPFPIIGILIHVCFFCSVPYVSYFYGKSKNT